MQRVGYGRISKSALVCSTAISMSFALSGVCFAQDQNATAGQTLQEVVVTGSRIAKKDFSSPSPIVTVGSQSFENRASPQIEQNLNQLPQFHADTNSQIGQAGAGQPSA